VAGSGKKSNARTRLVVNPIKIRGRFGIIVSFV
jgi:hypothetical protein